STPAALPPAPLPPRVTDPVADPPRRTTSSDTSMEELSPALLRAIQHVVAVALREHVPVAAPPRVAPPPEADAPDEEDEGEIPIPVLPAGRRCNAPLPEPHEVPPQWLARLEHLQKDLQDFASSRKVRKTELSLFVIRQGEGEPLKDYLQRFNTAALEVPAVTQEVKASAFSQGLLDGDFFKSLAKKPVSKLDALMARAAKYINMEEAQIAKKDSRGEKRKEIREEAPSKKPRGDLRDRKLPFERVNAVYTPLTVPIAQALMAVEETGLIARPRSWRDTPKWPNSDKFYRFHNDYGHTTEECRHLKKRSRAPTTHGIAPSDHGERDHAEDLLVKVPSGGCASAYNVILGRPTINTFQAVLSTYHMKIKFPTVGGVGEVQGDPLQSRRCYVEVIRKGQKRNVDDASDQIPPSKKGKTPEGENSEETETPAKVQPAEELPNIEIIPGNPDKIT
ncbi:UNVERIFIED_CONTAM: hypothetical protein Sradi_6851700, partial [Sesamum radiatum]